MHIGCNGHGPDSVSPPDHEAKDASRRALLDQLMPRDLAESLEVQYRAGVGREDLQGATSRDLTNCFLGLENRHGAAKSRRVERFIGHRSVRNPIRRRGEA